MPTLILFLFLFRFARLIGYHLGMRRGEILRLHWDQVDWDANLIRLE